MKIAFTGPICSGKSTLSLYLKENYNFKILNFAGKVKYYCKELFNMNHKDRALLQDFANKCREIDPNVWVNLVRKDILKNTTTHMVIDDLRYPNEYSMLKNAGFIIIRLDISESFQKERIVSTYPLTFDEHLTRLSNISESHYDNFQCDYIFKIKKKTQKDIKNNIKVLLRNISNE